MLHLPTVRYLVTPRRSEALAVAASLGIPLNFGLAYLFTDQVHRLMAEVHRTELWVGLLALVAVVGWLGLALWRRNRRLLIGDESADEPGERPGL